MKQKDRSTTILKSTTICIILAFIIINTFICFSLLQKFNVILGRDTPTTVKQLQPTISAFNTVLFQQVEKSRINKTLYTQSSPIPQIQTKEVFVGN